MLSYFKEHAKISPGDCERLAVVITYNRINIVGKWLRAWNNAEHYGYKLAVIHACDGDAPNKSEMENILSYNPDFYLPIKNTSLRDFGAFVMIHEDLLPLPEWRSIAIFTDDMLPMRRTFLKPFATKIENPNTGLVAQCYEPKRVNGGGGHIRTVAYALKREVVKLLELPFWRSLKPGCGHQFEYKSNDHVMSQVQGMGYDVELCHSEIEADDYQHWTSFLDWMWDCHLLEGWTEYWDVYEEQFNTIQRIEGIESEAATLVSVGQISDMCSSSNKGLTVLIPTKEEDFCNMAASALSVAAYCPKSLIHGFVFGIGGENEDFNSEKHRFVDLLGEAGYDVTTVRTYGRTDVGAILQQASSLCRSEAYLALFGGCIIRNKRWSEEAEDFLRDEKLVAMCHGTKSMSFKEEKLVLPHFSHTAVACKTKPMMTLGASWMGFEYDGNFHIGNLASYSKSRKCLRERALWDDKIAEECRYSSLVAPPGSFVIDKAARKKSSLKVVSDSLVCMPNWTDYDTCLKEMASIFRSSPKLQQLFMNCL